MKILAVDDDPVFLETLTRLLEPRGLPDLATSESADEALEMIASDPHGFDCFLLDISMPGKNGIWLCQEIRSIECHKETPILMVTASSDLDHIDQAFAAGATDYISKPLRDLELGARIRVAMMLNEQSRQLAKAAIDPTDRIELGLQDSIKCFDGELAIRHVPGIRDLQTLEIDLLRLPHGNYNLAVFALKVEDADLLFAEFGVEDFRNVMSVVARSIAAKLDLARSSFAYAGKGIFGAMMFGRDLRSAMNRLQKTLCQRQEINVGSDDVRTVELRLILTESKTPYMWNGRSAADGMRGAIDRAESSVSDIHLQKELDARRLMTPIRPRRHKIDFKRFYGDSA